MVESKCHKIKKCIKRLDFFGSLITFTINNEYRYHSFIGGCLFIISIIISILYSFYCFWNFIGRNKIDFIYSRKIIESNPSINLKEINFNFAFGLQKFGNGGIYTFPNKDYFTYSMELIDWIGDNEGEMFSTNINLKKCEKEDFNNMVDYVFYSNDINTMLCPIITNDLNFTLDGLYTDYYFRFLRLNLSISDYGLNNLEETQNFLINNPLEMSIYFMDTSFDYQNRKNFISKNLNYIFKNIDLNFAKYTKIFISSLEYSTDENLIITKPTIEKNSVYDLSLDTFNYFPRRNSTNRLIGQFIIQASSTIYQLQRSYEKLPEFIAELAGFIGILLLILFTLIGILERQIIDNKLINHMLAFKGSKYNDISYFINLFMLDKKHNNIINIIENKDSIPIVKNKLGTQKVISKKLILNDNYLFEKGNENIIENEKEENNENNENNSNKLNKKSNFYVDNTNLKNRKKAKSSLIGYVTQKPGYGKKIIIKKENTDDSIKKIEETNDILNNDDNLNVYENNSSFKKEKKDNIRIFPLSYSEYFLASILFCFSKLQKRRYNATKSAEFRIHYYMDIFNFIKKMQEIDLLKYCFFDKDQIMIFDFISKTPFKIGNEGEEIFYKEREKIMVNRKNLRKDDMDEIFNSYRIIRIKDRFNFEDVKLLNVVKAEVEFLKE